MKIIKMFSEKAQICYCGSSKCHGYIGKVSQNTDRSSSDDSDSVTNSFTSILKEKQTKKRIYKKKTIHNDKNKLKEVIFIKFYSLHICMLYSPGNWDFAVKY